MFSYVSPSGSDQSIFCMTMLRLIIFTLQLIAACATVKDRVVELITSAGYPSEVHYVITEDGYNLTAHRIPPKKGTSRPEAFILVHGLIASSADWVMTGKDIGLGFILHDAGFDVWMLNCRGNTWSRKHLWLDPQFSQFWNFSFHEIGLYDVPAVVDKVISHTGNQKVHYIGHSQGTTVFFIMLSLLPKYNKKIAAAHLLAPVAFVKHVASPVALLVHASRRELEAFLIQNGFFELFPSSRINELGGDLLCGPKSPLQSLCIFLVYMAVGFSGFEIDRNFFPRIFDTTPAGVSLKQGVHYIQLVDSGQFRQYDYGTPERNYERYGRVAPPNYKLTNIKAPINMYAGGRDLLTTPQDINTLRFHLKNAKHRLKVIPEFNHIDVLYSRKAPKLIYKEIVSRTNMLTTSNSKFL